MFDSDLSKVPVHGKKAVAVVAGSAATGAIIGSLIPIIGTVIGAGAGGIIGGITVIVEEVTRKD